MTSWVSQVSSVVHEGALLVVDELDVAERPQAAEFLVDVGEAVGEGEEMGTDDDLKVKIGEEEGAMSDLVTKGLVGVVVTEGVEVGGRV